jgi:hypothetical protein
MKAFNETMERKEAERKDYQHKMAEWEADRKKKKSRLLEEDGQVESRRRKMEG